MLKFVTAAALTLNKIPPKVFKLVSALMNCFYSDDKDQAARKVCECDIKCILMGLYIGV